MPLADRTRSPVALITGGAKRVGRAIVERFCAGGFDVAFTYRDSTRAAEELAGRLSAEGREVAASRADFSSDAAPAEVVAFVRSRFGRLSVLVNCASMYVPDDQPNGASAALQERLMRVNTIAPARLTAEFSAELKAASGSVVNFVDILADRPIPSYSAYCASKAALKATTLAFARRLAPHVRVNGVAPGVIDWPEAMPDADRANYLQRVPLARAGTPAEAADIVYFLATAAPYVTGQIIALDGGRSVA